MFFIQGRSWLTIPPTIPAKNAAMTIALAVGPVRFPVIVSKAWLKGRASPPVANAVPGSRASAVPATTTRLIKREDIRASRAEPAALHRTDRRPYRFGARPIQLAWELLYVDGQRSATPGVAENFPVR